MWCAYQPPAQDHINPILKLAKILNYKGFFVTFINTDFNHQRLLRSLGSDALHDHPSFHFETIPDGLPPPENPDATQDGPSLIKSLHETGLGPFKSVLTKVSSFYSPVTCIVADFLMGFTLTAAEELGIPAVLFWTSGTASLICLDHYPTLIQKGLMPLKDGDVLNTLSLTLPFCYSIGPLHLLENNIVDKSLESIKSNLWKEEPKCLKWLDAKEPSSVIYVNFGSITVMTHGQLVEFCWGLANSNHPFLWIIRPDLVIGDSAVLSPEFLVETSSRGLLASWCPQEQVLSHQSIGGFLTQWMEFDNRKYFLWSPNDLLAIFR
ncbi:hypothetical protein L1987_07918 [Smallanthus sonchifolius]|uniref:Uncharacterized protein n=1 Tax=Smallanthus sonchifolius TaxID=185202 RepID=A0ACB9JJ58_9ASTR|nr:hypothetical protein L1987_07918 [Smallanthus sonchifolius]